MNTTKHSLIAASAILVVALILYTQTKQTEQQISTMAPSGITATPVSTTTGSGKTYKQSETYQTPGQTESINVSMTVENGVVKDIQIDSSYNDRESVRYQNAFSSEVAGLVVGKKISEINLSRVAGSSLTTEAFMRAVEAIKLSS